ncbi:hypothetical protein OSTOST_13224, partial [Ostertagia ostertagi]
MSIGLSSPARYSLSYVDSLLTDFTQYPQKSIQFVFQFFFRNIVGKSLLKIVKFATEEQPSRSVLELAGARHIFNALTDRVSAELQDAEASNDSQLPLLVQSVSSK